MLYLVLATGLKDVHKTYADIDNLTKLIGFKPKTTIEEGIHRFVKWFKSYYR